MLLGDVAEVAEEIIRETCKEPDIEVIDMAVNVDHVHLFIKNPFRKSVYKTFKKCFIKNVTQKCFEVRRSILLAGAKRIKGRSSKLLRDQFPQLKEWCPGQFYADFPKGNPILQSKIGQYWAPSCYH